MECFEANLKHSVISIANILVSSVKDKGSFKNPLSLPGAILMIILKYHLIFYILNKQNSRAAPSLRSTDSQPSAQWFIKKKEIVIKKI